MTTEQKNSINQKVTMIAGILGGFFALLCIPALWCMSFILFKQCVEINEPDYWVTAGLFAVLLVLIGLFILGAFAVWIGTIAHNFFNGPKLSVKVTN
jgi:hypothetical protein